MGFAILNYATWYKHKHLAKITNLIADALHFVVDGDKDILLCLTDDHIILYNTIITNMNDHDLLPWSQTDPIKEP